ncbi:MAG: hypothetical protein JOY64_15930 [Alphaproteobacteria bacterium]|nr:hypothetical protein [Alphaproteobacteria bacterium]MBV8409119.1 hypothetical protein [Alphaproteobacteria bacterium]
MKPIGIFNNALASLSDGQQAQLQLDNFGRLLVTAGAGSPGAPVGAVQSVQGVSAGIPLSVVGGAPTSSLYSAASVSISASGDNTVVAGIVNQTIRLYALALTLAAPIDVTLKDGSTVLGTFQGVTSLVFDPLVGNPRWVTGAGNNLIINLASAVACKGTVWFTQS